MDTITITTAFQNLTYEELTKEQLMRLATDATVHPIIADCARTELRRRKQA